MVNYMQSITPSLIAGFGAAYIPMHDRTMFSYGARLDRGEATYLASYNPMNPHEACMAGVVTKPSKRLNLFAELKTGKDGKTATMVGYRARFQEGMVTGTVNSKGAATANYRKFIDMFEVTFTGAMDFSKPASPA